MPLLGNTANFLPAEEAWSRSFTHAQQAVQEDLVDDSGQVMYSMARSSDGRDACFQAGIVSNYRALPSCILCLNPLQ